MPKIDKSGMCNMSSYVTSKGLNWAKDGDLKGAICWLAPGGLLVRVAPTKAAKNKRWKIMILSDQYLKPSEFKFLSRTFPSSNDACAAVEEIFVPVMKIAHNLVQVDGAVFVNGKSSTMYEL